MSASEKGCENITDLRVVRPDMCLFQQDFLIVQRLVWNADLTHWAAIIAGNWRAEIASECTQADGPTHEHSRARATGEQNSAISIGRLRKTAEIRPRPHSHVIR
jgi:hypothetical protein